MYIYIITYNNNNSELERCVYLNTTDGKVLQFPFSFLFLSYTVFIESVSLGFYTRDIFIINVASGFQFFLEVHMTRSGDKISYCWC